MPLLAVGPRGVHSWPQVRWGSSEVLRVAPQTSWLAGAAAGPGPSTPLGSGFRGQPTGHLRCLPTVPGDNSLSAMVRVDSLGRWREHRSVRTGSSGTSAAAAWARSTSPRWPGTAPGLDDGCRVALKVIHPHLLETPGFFKRFLREAEIGKAVEQDNVVRCFDCDALLRRGHQQHFLVMEYVEGQTLRDLLERAGAGPRGALPPHRPGDRQGPRRHPRGGRHPPRPEARERAHHRRTTSSRSWTSAWRGCRTRPSGSPRPGRSWARLEYAAPGAVPVRRRGRRRPGRPPRPRRDALRALDGPASRTGRTTSRRRSGT